MNKRKTEKAKAARPKRDKKLQAIYDRIRKNFSAADLQKFTVIEPMVPAEQVLEEMKEIHRQYMEKNKNHATPRRKR